MQLKPVAKVVNRVRRYFRKIGAYRQNGLDHLHPKKQDRLPVPILSDTFCPPPLTLPVSPRSGRSSTTLSPQANDMERSDSAGTSGEGGSSTTESGFTALSGTNGGHLTSSESEPVTTGSSDSPPEAAKEALESEETNGELPVLSGPPPEHADPEVPDPFLVDDEEDPLSDEDLGESSITAPADEISSARLVTLTTPPLTPLTPNVNKAVPPPPPPDTDEDSDDAPELYLPGLVIPTMFLPIPNVRRPSISYHLTWWLSSKRVSMYHNHSSTRLIR